jgi:hypothetical protein
MPSRFLCTRGAVPRGLTNPAVAGIVRRKICLFASSLVVSIVVCACVSRKCPVQPDACWLPRPASAAAAMGEPVWGSRLIHARLLHVLATPLADPF